MNNHFNIIGYRIKERIGFIFDNHYCPQLKIEGRGWHYIFQSKDRKTWLLLKRSWHWSSKYEESPEYEYTEKKAEKFLDNVKYTINCLNVIKHNRRFSLYLPGENAVEFLRQADRLNPNNYYFTVDDIKVSFLRL